MTKRQIIDDILVANPTAAPEFLAQFEQNDLLEYLRHLEVLRVPRLTGDASRYSRYFPATRIDDADELSVLAPIPAAQAPKCPAAVVNPVETSVMVQDELDLADFDGAFDEQHSDPRADTIEFDPIHVADPAPTREQPVQSTASAHTEVDVTYEPEPDMVATNAAGIEGEQESWLF